MPSAVDICNEALDNIGARTTINSLADPSPQAAACRRAYDPLRKALLRTAPWNFCRKQVNLSLLGTANDGTVPFPWMYMYAYPADCMKFRYLLQVPTGWPFPSQPSVAPQVGDTLLFPYYPVSRRAKFALSTIFDAKGNPTKVVLTNTQNAIGVYSYDCDNVDQFDRSFWEALVALVSEKVIMPLTGNVQMKAGYMQIAKDRVMDARAADGNEGLPTVDHVPDWITVRGFQANFYYSGYPTFGGGSMGGFSGEGWDNLSWGD